MAAYLSRLHHISLHVCNVDKVAHELVSRLQFRVFAARLTAGARQLAFRKGAAVFVLTESASCGRETRTVPGPAPARAADVLYDVRPHYSVDSACNVCFEVEDVERSSESLRARGCAVLVPPTRVRDDTGLVTYSVVKSIVGNVCHTLVDTSRYRGPFLPGFCEVGPGAGEEEVDARCPVTHFDHVTYACPRRSTAEVMHWYERNFGFRRFFINSNEDAEEGYVLDQDGIGLRLAAMEYWKCSETGIGLPFKDGKEPDCKFVIAESLPEQCRNQVDTFLEQHGGPGIQHVGLFTQDIVSTARTMANAGIQFVSPPEAYYSEVGRQQEIQEAGHDPKVLMQHGILLDTDLRVNSEDPSACSKSLYLVPSHHHIFGSLKEALRGHRFTSDDDIKEAGLTWLREQKKNFFSAGIQELDERYDKCIVSHGDCVEQYLLQVFTKPIFSEDTFFLELIERRGATGFGEGNIRALWRSVQSYMEKKEDGPGHSLIKSKQRGQH